jgi:hypothetical protein
MLLGDVALAFNDPQLQALAARSTGPADLIIRESTTPSLRWIV